MDTDFLETGHSGLFLSLGVPSVKMSGALSSQNVLGSNRPALRVLRDFVVKIRFYGRPARREGFALRPAAGAARFASAIFLFNCAA